MGLGRVADTSWLYAVFHADDAFHAEATSMVLEPRPTLVPAAIMVETLELIRYRLGKEAAVQVADAIAKFPHFDAWYPVSEKDAVAVWKEERHLSLNDAHAVALARSTGFDLTTFDERQAAATPKP